MTENTVADEALYSPLANDPDLSDIVEMFVDEMSERVNTLKELLGASDWEGLRRAAHQLKGAAGSYGFAPITPSAAAVEDGVRVGQSEEHIRDAVLNLCDLCGRVRPGVPN